jgi:hypothetical protein
MQIHSKNKDNKQTILSKQAGRISFLALPGNVAEILISSFANIE